MERDTSPAERARYEALLIAAGPQGRMRATIGLCSAVRTLAVAGIRSRHPTADAREVQVRLAARLYGREVAARLYGPLPLDVE